MISEVRPDVQPGESRARTGDQYLLYGIVDVSTALATQTADGVRFVRGGALAAACSTLDAADVAALQAESGVALVRLAQCHDEIVRGLAGAGPVLPVRLGALFPDANRVAALLHRSQYELLAQLARVRGRSEWTVRIDALPMDGEPTRTAPQSGAEYLMMRREARRKAEQDRELRSTRVAQLDEALRAFADDSCRKPARGAASILAASYLIADTRVADLARALNVAALALRAVGCGVVVDGPLPPYSFVDVELCTDDCLRSVDRVAEVAE